MTTGVDIPQLPSLPLAERSALPTVPAIYFALSESGEVLYIGRSRSLSTRWQAHHRFAQLQAIKGVRIAWLVVDDIALLSQTETDLIQHFGPVLNGQSVERQLGERSIHITVPQSLMDILREIKEKTGLDKAHLGREGLWDQVKRIRTTHPAYVTAPAVAEGAAPVHA